MSTAISTKPSKFANFAIATQDHQASFWPCIGDYPLYDPYLYELMSCDTIRNDFYSGYLHAVRGKSVVDIGTGANAHWAIACIESGASHVYAIEASTSACTAARKCIKECGMEESITVIEGFSTSVSLPERVDVCVTEIFGEIASGEGVIAYIQDAKMRLLTDNATIIPSHCLTKFAPVLISEELFSSPAFDPDAIPYIEKIFEFADGPFDLRLSLENFEGNYELYSAPGIFEDIDLEEESSTNSTNEFTVEISKSGSINGILAWLCFGDPDDRTVQLDIRDGLTNWNPVFFPLWEEPVDVSKGDRLTLMVKTTLAEDGWHPDYHLRCRITNPEGKILLEPTQLESNFVSKTFRASKFYQKLFPA